MDASTHHLIRRERWVRFGGATPDNVGMRGTPGAVCSTESSQTCSNRPRAGDVASRRAYEPIPARLVARKPVPSSSEGSAVPVFRMSSSLSVFGPIARRAAVRLVPGKEGGNVHGNRNREVVQRREGLRIHHPGRRWSRRVRAFQRDRG